MSDNEYEIQASGEIGDGKATIEVEVGDVAKITLTYQVSDEGAEAIEVLYNAVPQAMAQVLERMEEVDSGE